jgi:hypothetical protein
MLVCSKRADEVEYCLRATGFEIIAVNDGETAISEAQHASFDMAVLVSTGQAMDVTETVFNLRDISPPMQIIVIAEECDIEPGAPAQMIADACPNTLALTIDGLAAYLGVYGMSGRRETRRLATKKYK